MNKSTTENFQPEQKLNNEPQPMDSTSSPAIGNTNVIGSFCFTKFSDVAKYYIGCKLKTNEGIGTFDVYWSGGKNSKCLGTYDLVTSEWSFEEVKPILRQLSSIRIEEAAKVVQMVFHPNTEYPITDYKLKINDAGNAVVYLTNDWYEEDLTFGNITGSIWSVNRYSHTIKVGANVHIYLMSKGFDLFNLIDNGEAVLK